MHRAWLPYPQLDTRSSTFASLRRRGFSSPPGASWANMSGARSTSAPSPLLRRPLESAGPAMNQTMLQRRPKDENRNAPKLPKSSSLKALLCFASLCASKMFCCAGGESQLRYNPGRGSLVLFRDSSLADWRPVRWGGGRALALPKMATGDGGLQA